MWKDIPDQWWFEAQATGKYPKKSHDYALDQEFLCILSVLNTSDLSIFIIRPTALYNFCTDDI